MPARRSRFLALGLLALSAALPAAAETLSSPVRFPVRDGHAVRRAAEAGDRLLDLDPAELARMKAVRPGEKLRLERFPFFPGATGDLLLERFEVMTPDAQVLVQGPDGTRSHPLPPVSQFRGTLAGDPDSRVHIAVHGDFLVAIAKTSAGLVYLGPDDSTGGPGEHVLRTADSAANARLQPLEWRCDQEELPPTPAEDLAHPAPGFRPAGALETLAASAASRDAALSIETDQELLAKFGGSVTQMTAYVTTLVGQISVIYERDVAVRLTVNRIQAWSTTDPYTSTSPSGQLNEVGDWWHGNRPMSSYPRTIVHYLSGKPVTGGIAWLGVLCQGDFSQSGHWGGGYGVTQINGAYPASLWDLVGVAHEIGHNFGTPHTHCFSPAIDRCYGGEGGCYAGPTVHPGPLGGTIMSYCHLLIGGFANLDLRFHARCVTEKMLPEIGEAACLSPLEPPPPATSASFYTLTPCRALDTRAAAGAYGGPALAANSERSFPLSGRCGIPPTAKAISANVTATQATSSGYLRVHGGGTVPLASAVNYGASQTRANSGLFPLGTGGNLSIRCDQPSGIVHAIIDVNGYFQ